MIFKFQLLFLSLLGLGVYSAPLSGRNEAQITKRGAKLNEFLNVLLEHLPVVSESLNQGTALITNLSKLLGTLTGAQDTYNEAGGSCKEWTVVFARGTSEPGNVGILMYWKWGARLLIASLLGIRSEYWSGLRSLMLY